MPIVEKELIGYIIDGIPNRALRNEASRRCGDRNILHTRTRTRARARTHTHTHTHRGNFFPQFTIFK